MEKRNIGNKELEAVERKISVHEGEKLFCWKKEFRGKGNPRFLRSRFTKEKGVRAAFCLGGLAHGKQPPISCRKRREGSIEEGHSCS